MRISDAHLHLFSNGFEGALGPPPKGCGELALYEHLRRHHRIDRGLVIGYEGGLRYAGNNDYLLSLAPTRSWMVVLAYLPVSPPPTVQQLRSLFGRGAGGFSLYLPGEAEVRALTAWPAAVISELNRGRSILSLNVPPAPLSEIMSVLATLECCSILVSHLGMPGRFAHPPSLDVARARLGPLIAAARFPNVSVKLSGLYGCCEPAHDFPHGSALPFIDIVLDTFGPTRLLWGSDFAPALDFVSFAQLVDTRVLSPCSSDDVDGIMGGNLLRLLNDG